MQNTLDADGKPLSLAEQDMIGVKATMRIAFLVVKPDAFAAIVPGATVKTGKASSITATGAVIKGNIATDGAQIAATGVAYSTTSGDAYATTSETESPAQSGAFSVTLSGLTAATKYYARAYVTVNGETRYGNEVSFTTAAASK